MVYLMFPIAFVENGRVYLLGLAVSLVYFAYTVWMEMKINGEDYKIWELTIYATYIFFLNLICMFFSGFREYYMRRGVLSRYQLVYQNMIYQMSMKKEKALLDSIMPLMLARVLQDAITSHIEDDPNGLVPFSRTR